MPTNYSDELRSYNKQQLIKLFLEVQQQSNKAISKLTNEISLLKENYKKLESDRSVSKTVKFSKRKLCQQVLREKQELKNVDPSEFDFPEGTDLFINESLCFYYKMLWNKCKKLWGKKSIYTYFTSNGNIRYRIRENGDVDTVTNITDFKFSG